MEVKTATEITGRVFSIEEFATFDGPGVRMSVFMKGCPLSCTWCHNPEGQSHELEYAKSLNGCVKCNACMADGKLSAASVKACARGLVRVCGVDYTVDALTEKIMLNAGVLAMSGGGVTFSGGEPLMQAAFVTECARRLKNKVHTALQTSGYASETVFRAALAAFDYVLYDLKLMDEAAHRKYCGRDNRRILQNYQILSLSGVPFVTRIPLIPGVTDTEQNLTAVARFMNSCGVKYAELLPYNKYAGSKYESVGRVFDPQFDENVPPSPHVDIFNDYGIDAKVL